MAGHLVAAQDDVTEILLGRGAVVKTDFLRPDGVEENAARRGLDQLLVGVAEDGLFAVIGIVQEDGLVRGDDLFLVGEENFIRVGKDDEPFLFIRLFDLFDLFS